MVEVEVAMKVKQDKRECERILLAHGYEEFFKTQTRDVYFAKNARFESFSEYDIKKSCIRLRNFESFHNLQLLGDRYPNEQKVDFDSMVEIVDLLKKNGFRVIFDTRKSDWVYKKGNSYHQLQDIENIGLLDYCYDEDIFEKTEEQQFEILKSNLISMGFELEFEEGVDKLRTLYHKEYKFSKNQNAKYGYLYS